MYRYRFLFTCLSLLISLGCNGAFIPLPMDKQEKIIGFFNLKSGNLLITNKQIVEISALKYKPILYAVAGFSDATVFKDTLVLLKNDTLFFIPSKNHFNTCIRCIDVKKLLPAVKFETVHIDEANGIWLSNQFNGLYTLTDGKLINRLNVPVINEVKLSADTCIWVGTNLGLYKYTEKLNSWQKYSEEALGGYDMPDNIVEHIYPDKAGAAWVTMPAYISYVAKGEQEDEIPSFNYLGDAQTQLLHVQLLKKGYLMATNKGIIYLSRVLNHKHATGEEIHTQDRDNTGIHLSSPSLHTPNELLHETVVYVGKDKNTLYLLTQKGYWTIAEKKIIAVK
jgi:hypothetical protein